MTKMNGRKNIIIGIALLIFVAVILIINTSKVEVKRVESPLNSQQKKYLKYNYEIPNTLNVLDIISENELLIEEDSKLKLYNLDSENSGEVLGKASRGNSIVRAKYFDGGVVWVEYNNKNVNLSNIFIKYFSDDSIIKLNTSNFEGAPWISSTSKYLTYYVVDNNKNINVNLFNLEERTNKVIAVYRLENAEGNMWVSTPSTNDSEVVWSGGRNEKISLYSYNIKEDTVKILLEDSDIYNPVVKGDRLFAIKRHDFFDSEFDCEYASDFIVEYDFKTNQWDKFEKDKINNYISSLQESVGMLWENEGPLFWGSKYIYDTNQSRFISVEEEGADFISRIILVKNNVICFDSLDYEDKKSRFIYIF